MTVTPATYDLTIYQGSDFNQQVTFLQTVGGDAVNLENITFRMQIRPTRGSPNIIADLSSANGKITKVDATGVVNLLLTSVETAALTLGGVYDLEAIHSVTSAERWLGGKVTLDTEVTR
jgi:hypothetical protein